MQVLHVFIWLELYLNIAGKRDFSKEYNVAELQIPVSAPVCVRSEVLMAEPGQSR